MAMDSASGQSHHHQEVGSQTLESMLASTKAAAPEKKPRPAEQSLKCPRCDSSNTKFCYYNNYSLSQPRYFCKSCRRYWTKGGTLRNVPVGGGCRKNKRSSSSSSSSSSARRNQDHPIAALTPPPYDPVPGFQPKPTPGGLGLDDPGLIDALRGGGFLEISRGFHNFYGGSGDGGSFGMECGPGVGVGMGMGMGVGAGMGMGIGMLNQEMGLMGFDEFCSGGAPAVATAAMKQEMCGGGSGVGGEKWGLNPWQSAGGVEDLDSTKIGSWNGIGSSNWHGLLNSPLM